MINLFKYRLKTIVNDRANMFWTLLFPILLGTLFFFSFGNLVSNAENFQPITVAIVGEGDSYFGEVLDEISTGNEPLLDVTETDRDSALALLEDEAVLGVYDLTGEPELVIRENGMHQSILKNVLDGYLQVEATITNIAQRDPAMVAGAVGELAQPRAAVEKVSLADGDMNYMRENFYALIAMAALYSSFFGLSGAQATQADLSPLGARRSITPTRKFQVVLSDILAAVLVMFAVILVLLFFINFVFGVDLGGNVPALMLASLCGVFVGVMLGVFVGVAGRGSRGSKEGILISLTLVLCFLSGLMYSNIRFVVEHNAPIVNRINPAALLVDSFYTLDMYGVGARYWTDIGLLTLIGGILCVASVALMRRKQYASL